MTKQFFNSFLKAGIPVNIIQDESLRVIIQDDDLKNDGWESSIRAIKLLIDTLPIDFIEKDTEDSLISEKISLFILDCVDRLLTDRDIASLVSNKSNVEATSHFAKLVSEERLLNNIEFKNFLYRYK
ncbi:hypothetical protein [Bacillus sp. PK3_68]|uniref:hypothetical protein n=1 Tax=Bacillus sp. PK3_68 TaxID=2027408 RepID=UPI000E73829B|nr:hypothetical protein [Bacillus sp. PK3_68]RJS61753.1 hypothetical protein CJ483_18340 [Bacillus sp. PK3_68]